MNKNNGRPCSFRIDTGSDVTILRDDFLRLERHRIPVDNCLFYRGNGFSEKQSHR